MALELKLAILIAFESKLSVMLAAESKLSEFVLLTTESKLKSPKQVQNEFLIETFAVCEGLRDSILMGSEQGKGGGGVSC